MHCYIKLIILFYNFRIPHAYAPIKVFYSLTFTVFHFKTFESKHKSCVLTMYIHNTQTMNKLKNSLHFKINSYIRTNSFHKLIAYYR
jgi:hypothetical protein